MTTKRKAWIVFILFAAVVILGGLTFYYLSPRDPFFRSRAFDSKTWIAGAERVRGEMAGDLRASKLLDGKTHAQVEALLGPPDSAGTNGLGYSIDVGYRMMGHPWLYSLSIKFDAGSSMVQYVDLKD